MAKIYCFLLVEDHEEFSKKAVSLLIKPLLQGEKDAQHHYKIKKIHS